MKIAFILKGGLDRDANLRREIEALGDSSPFPEILVLDSEYSGHGIALAQSVAASADYLIAVGGDGTLNEVINGCLQAKAREPGIELPVVGLVSRGTANDFRKSAQVQGTLDETVSLAFEGKAHSIDLGLISFRDRSHQRRSRYFVNVCDIGIGAAVVKLVNQRRHWPSSVVNYSAAILQSLLTYKKPCLHITTDRGQHWDNKALACIIGNGCCFGAGLYATPEARLDDGLFHCTVIGDVNLLDFLRHLGKLRRGERISHPEVQYLTASQLEISSDSGECSIDVDGECLFGREVVVTVVPAAISILMRLAR